MPSELASSVLPKIKCVVWDLDNTLWSGTISEGDDVQLMPGVLHALRTFDARGILQSVASKNDFDLAWGRLRDLGVAHFFIYPEIHWNSKAGSLQNIAKAINIGIDTLAFIDDQAFEREEVAFSESKVRTFAPEDLSSILNDAAFTPRFITEDSARRREMYQSDQKRNADEADFKGPNDAFLATLDMSFSIRPAEEEDLKRAEELTVRTNQLNTTGKTYSYEELATIRKSTNHKLLVAELVDKHGSYGKIGLVLLELSSEVWTIKLLLMSCRVMARGVGGAMITFLRRKASESQVRLLADFVENDRNRMMFITYKFAGFRELEQADGSFQQMESNLSDIPDYPAYLKIEATL